MHALRRKGWRVTASMHSTKPEVRQRLEAAGAQVIRQDLSKGLAWNNAAREATALIFSTHLGLTNRALAEDWTWLAPSARIVALSSNNVAVHGHAPSYRELAQEEARLRRQCANTVIIRPTLIYGDPRLVLVARLMRLARRLPIIPLPGSGRALVQPIFHEDVANVAAALAGEGEPGVYALGGPDIVTMREFFQKIARACQSRARVVCIPRAALKFGAPLMSGLLTAEQIERADYDRIAVVQSHLPSIEQPRVTLDVGLAHLARTLAEADGRGARA